MAELDTSANGKNTGLDALAEMTALDQEMGLYDPPKPVLQYIGRPTHYQTEVYVKAGETVELDLPNGRIPIFMDFVGDLYIPQTKHWFDVFFPKQPELRVHSGAFILQWYFSIDDEGNTLDKVSVDFAYKADGIIRVLLVEPSDQED